MRPLEILTVRRPFIASRSILVPNSCKPVRGEVCHNKHMNKLRRTIEHPLTQLGVIAFGALAETTINKHRIRTHRSIVARPMAQRVLDILGAPFADTDTWAAVHRVHHSTPDANLHPFLELADYIKWREAHPGAHDHIELPETILGFDPGAKEMTLDEVLTVGELTRDLVDGMYHPQENYSDAEVTHLLDMSRLRYAYDDRLTDKPKAPIDRTKTLDDLAPILRDPHSPVLEPAVTMRGIATPGGVIGTWLRNRPRYDEVDGRLRYNPELRNPDIITTSTEQKVFTHKNKIRLAAVGAAALARIALTRPETPAKIMQRGVEGAAIFGGATAALLFGGNTTNAWGHAGDLSARPDESHLDNMRRLVRGEVRMKADGTYTTNNKILSAPTFDEVGGQKEHHDHPDYIAYTREIGVDGFRDAPFGSVLKLMADRGILFEHGPGFEGNRPDLPSDAILALESIRRAYYQNNLA